MYSTIVGHPLVMYYYVTSCIPRYINTCMLYTSQFGSVISLHSLRFVTPHGGSVGMAQIQLPPPDRFNFRNPDDWPRWRIHFQQFREVSGLSGESSAKQISTLLYCLGEEAESVLASTNATADDRNDFNWTIGKFDDYFKVWKTLSTNARSSIEGTSRAERQLKII